MQTTVILDDGKLSDLEDLEEYPYVEKLSAGGNKLTQMKSLDALHALTCVNLPNNLITTIDGVSRLTRLTWLNLSGNKIQVVDNLQHNLQLRYLDVSDNYITHIVCNLTHLTQMKTVLFHGNQVSSLEKMATMLPMSLEIFSLAENKIHNLIQVVHLQRFQKLKQFSLMNNPCTQGVKYDYRPFIVCWCPSLKIIDSVEVLSDEKMMAEWLRTQSKCRSFGNMGQHNEDELCNYLLTFCPRTVKGESPSEGQSRMYAKMESQRQVKSQFTAFRAAVAAPATASYFASVDENSSQVANPTSSESQSIRGMKTSPSTTASASNFKGTMEGIKKAVEKAFHLDSHRGLPLKAHPMNMVESSTAATILKMQALATSEPNMEEKIVAEALLNENKGLAPCPPHAGDVSTVNSARRTGRHRRIRTISQELNFSESSTSTSNEKSVTEGNSESSQVPRGSQANLPNLVPSRSSHRRKHISPRSQEENMKQVVDPQEARGHIPTADQRSERQLIKKSDSYQNMPIKRDLNVGDTSRKLQNKVISPYRLRRAESERIRQSEEPESESQLNSSMDSSQPPQGQDGRYPSHSNPIISHHMQTNNSNFPSYLKGSHSDTYSSEDISSSGHVSFAVAGCPSMPTKQLNRDPGKEISASKIGRNVVISSGITPRVQDYRAIKITSSKSAANSRMKNISKDVSFDEDGGLRYKAAVCIQRVWRGYRCRIFNPRVRRWLQQKSHNQLHLQVHELAQQMQEYKRQSEEESHVRLVHSRAIHQLRKEVAMLKEWQSSMSDEPSVYSSQRRGSESYDTSRGDTTLSNNRSDVRNSLDESITTSSQDCSNFDGTLQLLSDPFTLSKRSYSRKSSTSVMQHSENKGDYHQLEEQMNTLHAELQTLRAQVQIDARMKEERLKCVKYPGCPLAPERLRWFMEETEEESPRNKKTRPLHIQWDASSIVLSSGALDYDAIKAYHIFIDGQQVTSVPGNQREATFAPPSNLNILHKIEVRSVSQKGDESFLSSPLYWEPPTYRLNRFESQLSCDSSTEASLTRVKRINTDSTEENEEFSDTRERRRFLEEALKIIDMTDSEDGTGFGSEMEDQH